MIRRMKDQRRRERRGTLEHMDMVAFDAARAALERAVLRGQPAH